MAKKVNDSKVVIVQRPPASPPKAVMQSCPIAPPPPPPGEGNGEDDSEEGKGALGLATPKHELPISQAEVSTPKELKKPIEK